MFDDNRGVTPAGIAIIVVILLIATSIITHFWLGPMIFEQNRQSGEQIAKDSLDGRSENTRLS